MFGMGPQDTLGTVCYLPAMHTQPPIVVLTGASSGIGAALAVELARTRSARIALLARREDLLHEVAEQVREAGGEALSCPCDVVDEEAVALAIQRVREEFGPIDLAIANAGIGLAMGARDISFSIIKKVMDVNYLGAATVLAAVVPDMLERQSGHVAVVSSIAGYRGLRRSGPYCASKAAVTTLLESLRLELAPQGVAVTAIHPGFIKTPMTDKNNFPMPFMVPVSRAAQIIAAGLLRRKREINFPWQMVFAVKLMALLPGWIFDRMMSRKPS